MRSALRPYLKWPYVLAGIVLLILAAAALYAWRMLGVSIDPAAIRGLLAQLGLAGPLALIAALAAVLVVPILPASVLQIGAGLAFGPWLGLLYATLADILGASIGFWLGRNGRSFLEQRLSPANHNRLAALTRRMSWTTVVLLRLIPGPAYPLVSLAAGHSHLPYWRYLTASLTGVLPALALLVLAGDLVSSSPLLAFAIVILVVASLAIAGRVLGVGSEQTNEE
ncbi:MAG: VTT domain-containing protein [Anaerolineae bacterium]